MGHPVRFTERGRQTFQGSETAPKAAYFELSEIMTGGSYERTEGTWAGSPAMEEGGVEVGQWRRIVGQRFSCLSTAHLLGSAGVRS